MRRITALFFLFITAACFGKGQHDHHAHQKQTQLGHVMISLPTMRCELCAETIQSAVEKIEGVKSVSIDLKKKMAHVNFDPEKTSIEKIEKAIAAAGYDANNTKRDEKAYAKLPKCCQSDRK